MSEYLYIIKCNEFYKIGIAADCKKRLACLQVGNPYKLELYKTYKISSPEITNKTVECFAHLLFSKLYVRGEWFELQDSEIEFLENVISAISNNDGARIRELRQMSLTYPRLSSGS